MFGGSISESSRKLYTSNIKRLNGGKEPKSAVFLNKFDDINAIIDKYADNTKKSYYITIVSYLKDKKASNKTKNYWLEKMNEANKSFRETSGEKTETQKKNWMEWGEVVKLHADYDLPKKIKDEKEYNQVLYYLILSLYVLTPPRRVVDYEKMKVVADASGMDEDFNYLDVKKKQFIFNQYKTKKAYGQQTEDIPDDLYAILKKLVLPKQKNFEPFFLLQDYSGDKVIGVTRALNKVFGKNISVSMLRNIFVSDKLGGKKDETKELAESMGTSPAVLQNVYSKDS